MQYFNVARWLVGLRQRFRWCSYLGFACVNSVKKTKTEPIVRGGAPVPPDRPGGSGRAPPAPLRPPKAHRDKGTRRAGSGARAGGDETGALGGGKTECYITYAEAVRQVVRLYQWSKIALVLQTVHEIVRPRGSARIRWEPIGNGRPPLFSPLTVPVAEVATH